MIRAFVEGPPPLYLFGLSAMNIKRLTMGQPIMFDLNGMRFVILYGETEDAMAADLEKSGLVDNKIDTRAKP